MTPSRVRSKLREGRHVLCAATVFSNPNIIEMLGHIGYDCVWICNEHAGINRESLAHLVRAARVTGIDAMIRIVRGGHDDVIQPFEMGAKGIMIPRVRDADHARAVAFDARFAPVGMRGIDGSNPDADCGRAQLADYIAHANENTFVALQIEDAAAVDRVEEIAAVPGIDILFVGPADLSQSYGITGDIRHSRIQVAIERTVRACERNGIACGSPGLDVEYGRRLMDLGVRFIAGPCDHGMVLDGFRRAMDAWDRLGFGCSGGTVAGGRYQ